MPRKHTKQMRIRYINKRTQPQHVVESAQQFRSKITGATYKVRLNFEEDTYQIINVNQRKIVKTGGKKGFTHYWLKKIAKRALESLGVDFNMELRNNTRVYKKKNKKASEYNPVSTDNDVVNN